MIEIETSEVSHAPNMLDILAALVAQREAKSLQHRAAKEAQTTQKAWRKLRVQTFNCLEDTLTTSQGLAKRWQYRPAQATASP